MGTCRKKGPVGKRMIRKKGRVGKKDG